MRRFTMLAKPPSFVDDDRGVASAPHYLEAPLLVRWRVCLNYEVWLPRPQKTLGAAENGLLRSLDIDFHEVRNKYMPRLNQVINGVGLRNSHRLMSEIRCDDLHTCGEIRIKREVSLHACYTRLVELKRHHVGAGSPSEDQGIVYVMPAYIEASGSDGGEFLDVACDLKLAGAQVFLKRCRRIDR